MKMKIIDLWEIVWISSIRAAVAVCSESTVGEQRK